MLSSAWRILTCESIRGLKASFLHTAPQQAWLQLLSCPVPRNVQEASGHLHLSLLEAICCCLACGSIWCWPAWLPAQEQVVPDTAPSPAARTLGALVTSAVQSKSGGHGGPRSKEAVPWTLAFPLQREGLEASILQRSQLLQAGGFRKVWSAVLCALPLPLLKLKRKRSLSWWSVKPEFNRPQRPKKENEDTPRAMPETTLWDSGATSPATVRGRMRVSCPQNNTKLEAPSSSKNSDKGHTHPTQTPGGETHFLSRFLKSWKWIWGPHPLLPAHQKGQGLSCFKTWPSGGKQRPVINLLKEYEGKANLTYKLFNIYYIEHDNKSTL